jgi:hypothetical protein
MIHISDRPMVFQPARLVSKPVPAVKCSRLPLPTENPTTISAAIKSTFPTVR